MASSSALQSFLLNPAHHDLLAILKGARNGIVYGVKIRFPHALVMTLLFSSQPWPAKIRSIFKATKTHALNLAKFVTIYKLLLLVQKRFNGGKERDLDSLFAGGLGGWWVFGERTPINEQIVLYVMGRTLLSFLPRLYSTSPKTALSSSNNPFTPLPHPLPPLTSAAANPRPIPPASLPFGVIAALSWAGVMYMFRHRGERITPGMASSMSKSYSLSEQASGWEVREEVMVAPSEVFGCAANADLSEYLYHDSEAWSDWRTLLWHNQ